MKNSFVSSLLLGLLFAGPALALGGDPGAEARRCLDEYDLACAEDAVARMPDSPDAAVLRARLAFSQGEFAHAHELLASAQSAFGQDQGLRDQLAQYAATVEATAGFRVERRGDVEIRYYPGLDEVLLEEAFETLQAAHDRIGPLLGGAPPGLVRMEIYPTGSRFTAASGLPAEAVQNTGVVALSKWGRLLVTSPRALGRGYAWKDTIAHEYIHYVVAWRTRDRAPVWLQEGIARSHEALWRQAEPAPLQPFQQALLAEALAGDALVPLERMHPSMAFLDSADQAALAFAQVSTMMEHLRGEVGPHGVAQVLDQVRAGTDALQAVANVGALGDVGAFMGGWRERLEGMNLVNRKLQAMPTVLGPADDEYGVDPVLAERHDLARHAHLGDLLVEAERPDAAMVEYQRAMPSTEPPGPVLSAKIAIALEKLGRAVEAQRVLEQSVHDYPEYAETRKKLAASYLQGGRTRDALIHYRAAADVNPFDPVVQAALADLYGAAGQQALAERHARYRRILALGGGEPAAASGGTR